MAAEMSDSIKPWTIRGVAPEERNAAGEAAKRSDMTLGEWLSRAIRTEIQQAKQANRVPVPVGQPVGQPTADSLTALSDVERIATAMRDMAAAGLPVPKGHAAQVSRALVAQLPQSSRRRRTSKSDNLADLSDSGE